MKTHLLAKSPTADSSIILKSVVRTREYESRSDSKLLTLMLQGSMRISLSISHLSVLLSTF